MTNEISPRTVRFSHNEDEVRPERSRRSHPTLADSENSNLTDHASRPTHPVERHSDTSTHSRYSESSSHPPSAPSLITTSTNGLPRGTNGSLRTAANRPGITRTPSNTYNPQRGPPPQPISHDTRAAKRTESAGPRRQRIAKNVDPTYVAVLQRRDGSYFPNEYPESDSEGETPSSEGPFDERYHDTDEHIIFQETFGDHEPTTQDLANPDNRERLEWYGMLQTVLTGDVVKQEKKRLIGTSDLEDIKTPQRSEELWIGIRSRTCGRTLAVQRKMVEDARASLDSVADWVTTFKVIGESEARKSHIEQMMDALGKIETLGSAYPSWKALEAKHKSVTSPSFREAYEAIVAWYNTHNAINTQLSILKRWVGNDSLDFQKTKPLSPSANGIGDESSFLDRLLKEDGMKSFHEEEDEKEEKVQDKKKIQRKPMLPCISEVVTKVKETTVQYHESFHKRHFPSYDEELLLLMTFPTRLIEDVIKVRLAYARKVKESAQQNPMMQDQMIGQFQLLLKLAIKIKQEYMAFAETQEGWDFAAPLDDSFDQVVLEALKYYFKMLNWKLSGNRNTFKEAELLFQEWEFANDIGSHLLRGGIQVSEHFSSLTFKALNRLSQTFEKEIQRKPRESALDMSKRYKACLDSVRVRQRMLQRFSRMLSDNYENACDFNIASTSIDPEALFDHLIDSNHFQLYTANIERDGIFLLASPSLWDRPDDIQRMMTICSEDDMTSDPTDPYVIIMRPEVPFTWYGQKMNITLQEDTIDLRLGHARLIASGSRHRLINARKAFLERLGQPLDLVVEQRSNFHKVNQKMTEIRRVAFKLSNTFMDSVEKLRNQTVGLDCQELIQTCFVFATEFGQRSLLIMDSNRRQMNNIKLTKLALDWVTFVCDDCKVSERKTFRWAVLALEFALGMTRGRQILALTDDEYAKLRSKVSGCMSILITHFDIMGARSMFAAQAERDKQRIDALMSYFKRMDENRVLSDDESSKLISRGRLEKLEEVEDDMVNRQPTRNPLGRVLEVSNDVDRSLIFLSSTASANMALRWQLGHFVGGGTFGNVYAAMNLDTGQLMAVKEIRLQDPKQIPAIAGQIKDEMAVLELLNHPNVVSYYGIEVHRDRVYIFMEYCSGGSLASLLEHGRIEDEGVIQVYALQLLEGLAYLHASSITHRDIKPENILLDHNGVIKYVDFGAAKVIARQGKTLVTSLTSTKANKSMTGTPMYMSPEVITGDKSGRASAADVWSLGCVILEMTTGRRPWANLDNEWAIMYNIANGNPPQLPSPDQLSLQGIDFLERCFARDPRERATAEKLLQHPWIMSIRNQVIEPPTPSESSASTMSTPLVTPTTSTGLSPTISMAAAAKMENGSGSVNAINVLNQELGR